MKIIDYYELDLPDYSLSYLVNGDASGLEDTDQETIDTWHKDLTDRATRKFPGCHFDLILRDDDEGSFTHSPEFGLACNCVDAVFAVFADNEDERPEFALPWVEDEPEDEPCDLSNPILSAYLECALWSSTDENSEPLDKTFTLEDFAPEAVKQAQADIDGFLAYCAEVGATLDDWTAEQLGHDFWLTRNRHGAGFWDRGLQAGEALTKAAKTFGSSDCYVGDNGKVYLS